ncbi:MAG: DNA polymerase I [Clostridia bacterium]|nr:DNA polymerase I [Clostridia bacterium]
MKEKLVVIDGNSILNRAFYGIMGSKMLMTADGTYTNAVYGFLAILFKLLEEVDPKYLVVAFDVNKPTKRHEMYKDYKGTRKGMPEELKMQMPIIKDVLAAMNICVMTKEGYEADDILGTLSKYGEEQGLDVILLTGDRDSFQLASDHTVIRIPRTKGGKTETDIFDKDKIKEVYGLLPKQMIEVKALQGDASDNIPGVPGIGEKTALTLIQEYGSVDNLYKDIESSDTKIKGKQLENLINNKELAYLSRTLGTIDRDAPIEKDLKLYEVVPWNRKEVFAIFKELRFNRYIERFELDKEVIDDVKSKEVSLEYSKEYVEENEKEVLDRILKTGKLYYSFETRKDDNLDLIFFENIKYANIYSEEESKVYTFKFGKELFKDVFENKEIEKYGCKMKHDYILLKQAGITMQNIKYDISIAAYLINSNLNAYKVEDIARDYLSYDITTLDQKENDSNVQTSLFDEVAEVDVPSEKDIAKAYVIYKSIEILSEKLKEIEAEKLFYEIEMPCVEVLADMQWEGIFIDEKELIKFGGKLKKKLEELTIDIYEAAGEEFNINSPKQLGAILFEKMKLPIMKKTKSGYATDVETLEKLRPFSNIIDKILDYRQVQKLNSTYVEGMIPHINEKTGRIHTTFHQTVTATGRLSSSDPNLQNIPTRTELGKKLRKVFKAEDGKIFLDADYSQIELRVLAAVSGDANMVEAFKEGIDIHTSTASKIFDVPIEEVSKQLRSKAKAVNFGIVYGISDFGLSEQVGINIKEAKKYIEQYLDKYSGIKNYMSEIVESTKKKGYVSTLLGRRRYIPELQSSNFMVRKFGERAAMNTPIQGTAADIIKIAMVNVYKTLKENNLKSKIVLQIHDELLIETLEEEKEEVKEILKSCMENAIKLEVPLNVEVEEGKNWFQAK